MRSKNVYLFLTILTPVLFGGCSPGAVRGQKSDDGNDTHEPTDSEIPNNPGSPSDPDSPGNPSSPTNPTNPTNGVEPDEVVVPVIDWHDNGYLYRRLIHVEAKQAGIPRGYSLEVDLNHQALVAAGLSRADGDDLRVFCQDAEHDRVLDDMSAWNTENTRLWFKLSVSVEPFNHYRGCYLYYGNEGSGAPPAQWVNAMGASGESRVFVAGTDFEEYQDGTNPADWADHGGANFQVTHNDSGAWLRLINAAVWSEGTRASALAPQDDAAWSVRLHYWQEGTNAWGGLGVRVGDGNSGAVVAVRDGGWLRTDAAFSAGGWQSDASVHFPLGSQGRLEVRTYGDQMEAVWHNPAGHSPPTATLFSGAPIAAASGGLDVFLQGPDGANNRWVDATHAIVRKYVQPEPTAMLGASESIASGWVDTTPPVISGGVPSGTLPAGTTEATLSVLTDEAAICRWDTTPQTFASLSHAFNSSDGYVHANDIADLTDGGGPYTIHVRCRDAAGNVSPAYSFTFDVEVKVVVAAGTVDPTLLPVATTAHVPQTGAFNALNVPSMAAGGFYLDPSTGVKIYKVTDNTFPTGGTSWHHDYSEGGDEVSWPYDGNTRAVLVRQGNGTYWLLDFNPGEGVSNARQLTGTLRPFMDLAFTFSNNPETPYYAYVSNGSTIRRFDIRTMAEAPGNGWPVTDPNAMWMHASERDGMFVWMRGAHGPTIVMYEPSTGTLRTYTNGGLNEPRIDRAGRYVGVSMGSPYNGLVVWDWSTNSVAWTTSGDPGIPFAHNASLRRRWVTVDWNMNFPGQFATFTSDVPNSGQRVGGPANGTLIHGNGNWLQYPENLDDQWAVFAHYGSLRPSQDFWLAPGGMVLMTPAGERRLLGHPYNTSNNYQYFTFAKFSPDGRYVMFTSNMNGSGRSDIFLAEMPAH